MNTSSSSSPVPDVDQAHRVLVTVCLGLVIGVTLFTAVATVLSRSGTFTAFLGFSPGVRGGIAAAFFLLLLAAYPLYRLAGGTEQPQDAGTALGVFQTRVIVSMAIREFVGIVGGLLILLSGDFLLGGTLAGLAVVTMLLAFPRKDDLLEFLRGLE